MLDDRIEKQVKNRITWALEEQCATRERVYNLFAGTEGISDNPEWRELTRNLADCESHLVNALRRFPDKENSNLET